MACSAPGVDKNLERDRFAAPGLYAIIENVFYFRPIKYAA